MARALLCSFLITLCLPACADQTVEVQGDAGGKRFDGIGAVSGGGATSVLLKDYPEPQRSQVLDLLFKPKFAASLQTLFVEIPGDGSTQGTEPSHMHSKSDENYFRGYEWWIMRQAKIRNPAVTLDGVAWSCPGWVGNRNFWSQDMCDYYVKWIKGLGSAHGLKMDAIGCRNEKGVNEEFIKNFRATLNAAGLSAVKLHGFDNWERNKFEWVKDMAKDPALRDAVDVVGNHTLADNRTPPDVRKMLDENGQADLEHGRTRLQGGQLRLRDQRRAGPEQELHRERRDQDRDVVHGRFAVPDPAPSRDALHHRGARTVERPLSSADGALGLRPLWAVYRDRLAVSQRRLRQAGRGRHLRHPQVARRGLQRHRRNQRRRSGAEGDLQDQRRAFHRQALPVAEQRQGAVREAGRNHPRRRQLYRHAGAELDLLVLDHHGAAEGFVRRYSAGEAFSLPLLRQFPGIPERQGVGLPAPLPHRHQRHLRACGRPDKPGLCLRQVLAEKAQSWSQEWMPYTVLGDKNWTDYEVSAEVYLDNGGWAGVMGRVNYLGSGTACLPRGYYLRLAEDGTCSLWLATPSGGRGAGGQSAGGTQLASGKAANVAGKQWHNVKLQFSASTIKGFVDKALVLTATNGAIASGMAGLVTGGENNVRNTAFFDNLIVNTVDGPQPKPAEFKQDDRPLY